MNLTVTNTLTRTKEPLVPREEGKIAMYVCGPTVYNHIHIGNARAFIVFDVIRRYLRWRGFDVTFVQNYTDVDDKIITKAAEESRSPNEVAREYSEAFEEVMDRLGISPPDVLAKATEHIGDMVAMIQTLIEKGFAYESEGNVWFAVESFEGYGKLSNRSLDDMRAGERVEPDPSKRNPLDFALWKAAKPGEPSWPSPWGEGRPGWHIECSVMSSKYLGNAFDIHGGGSDLIFPHHENEIAQAEAATGEPFVRYWLHNGMVNIEAEKMSKSLGNFVLVKDVLGEVSAEVVRLMAISGHYRSDVDFGEGSVAQARASIERFEIFSGASGTLKAEQNELSTPFLDRFRDAMDDDFNTPLAISVLHDAVRTGNTVLEEALAGQAGAVKRLSGALWAFNEIAAVLGIAPKLRDSAPEMTAGLIELALSMRESARRAGRYEEADQIRSRLGDLGVAIEDASTGTRWRLK